jgi:hypothetical protein
LQYALVGNAMADYFVEGCADRFGEVIVVKRRGVGLAELGGHIWEGQVTHVSFYAGIVDNFIYVVCGHSWPDLSSCDVEDFSGQSANFPHTILSLFVEYCDIIPP